MFTYTLATSFYALYNGEYFTANLQGGGAEKEDNYNRQCASKCSETVGRYSKYSRTFSYLVSYACGFCFFSEIDETAVVTLNRLIGSACDEMIQSVSHYKLHSTRMDKLWERFHKFSLQDGMKMCKTCDAAIGLRAHDVFWQLYMEKNVLARLPAASEPVQGQGVRELSRVEENAVRYTAGFVIKKLTTKYAASKGPKATKITSILKGMGGKILSNGDSFSSSSEWIRTVDRGGLFHVTNAVYDLFYFIEITIDEELSRIFRSRGKGIEKVRKEKLEWLCENEEVQIVWGIICPEDEEEVQEELLREIAFKYITSRGHSKARVIKEKHKVATKTSIKGKRSTRKELKRKDDE